jgi:hypothetical protein
MFNRWEDRGESIKIFSGSVPFADDRWISGGSASQEENNRPL